MLHCISIGNTIDVLEILLNRIIVEILLISTIVVEILLHCTKMLHPTKNNVSHYRIFFFTLGHCTNVAVIIWYQQKYRYTSSLQRKYCYRKSHEGDLTVLLRREAARESHAVIRPDVYFTNYVSVSHTGYRAHYLPICLWNDVKTWDP